MEENIDESDMSEDDREAPTAINPPYVSTTYNAKGIGDFRMSPAPLENFPPAESSNKSSVQDANSSQVSISDRRPVMRHRLTAC